MDKLGKIVDQLLSRTEDGSLTWEATAVDKCFQVSLTGRTIIISEEEVPAEIGVTDYFIEIINSSGQTIEEFSDRYLDKQMETSSVYYLKMKKLFGTARRQALGVDAALDDLLVELSQPGGSRQKR